MATQVIPPAPEPMNERCDHCGQRIPLQRKIHIDKIKCIMLKRAAEHVMSTMKNDFMVRDFTEPKDFKIYNAFSHLRLHGLIFKHTTDDGKVIKGRWGITRNGWAFLRNDKQLPRYVMVKNNTIQSRADLQISFAEVWRGEPTIQTSFEYFDDAGNPVGIRPSYPQSRTDQTKLI